MTPLEAALSYRSRGWAPIPLIPKDKTPAASWRQFQNRPPVEKQIRAWWTDRPDFNVGVVMGAASGNLVAVDIDPRNGGDGSIRGHHLPPTFSTRTGGGGWHCLYRSSKPLPKRIGAFPGIDLLGQGAYAVMPPSIHPNGESYEIAIDVGIEPATAWIVEAMLRKELSPRTAKGSTSRCLDAGFRNENLFRAACGFARGECRPCGGLRCRASSSGHLFHRVMALNLKKAMPPLDADEVWQIALNAWNLVRSESAKQRATNTNGLLLT
jgi:hypothetical protein